MIRRGIAAIPFLALPFLALIACSDPTGPCDRAGACEVEGFDLAVTAAYLAEQAGTDAATGHPVAPAGDITVEYVVRNRGTQTAPARAVMLWNDHLDGPASDSIPSLAPGDSAVLRTTLAITNDYVVHGAAGPGSDLFRLHVTIHDSHDAEAANDTASFEAHIPLPVLVPYIEPVTAAKIRIGEPFEVTYRLRNLSTRTAATDVSLRLCLWSDQPCYPTEGSTFGHVDVADLAPGAEFELTTMVAIPATATVHDEDYLRVLSVCLVPASWTDPYLSWDSTPDCAGEWSYIRVLPDYQGVCNAPVVGVDGTHVFTDHNCGHMALTAQQRGPMSWNELIRDLFSFHVIGIDALAGREYRLERSDPSGGLQIFDFDGGNARLEASAPGTFTFREAGRFYLVMYTDSPALSVTVR